MSATPHAQLPPDVRELYPWNGRFILLDGGHRLHYLDVGRGPAVVMVHGNPTWSFYYRDLIRDLSRDHRCIVVDHLGCGLSDKPADGGYHIADHVDNLTRLLLALELEDATLVVHDWGGPIGYATALKLYGLFTRFVVMNTAAFLLPLPRSLRALRLPVWGPVVVRGLNGFFYMGFHMASGRKDRFRGAVKKGYLYPYGSWADRRAILKFIQEIPIEEDHPTRWLLGGLAEGLPRLKDHPHLIYWGMQDPVFHPGYLEEWKRQVPGAEVHELADCGHWVLEEAHEEIVPAVRAFLAQHEPGGEA